MSQQGEMRVDPEDGAVLRTPSMETTPVDEQVPAKLRRLDLFGTLADVASHQFQLFVNYLSRMGENTAETIENTAEARELRLNNMKKEVSCLEEKRAELKRR